MLKSTITPKSSSAQDTSASRITRKTNSPRNSAVKKLSSPTTLGNELFTVETEDELIALKKSAGIHRYAGGEIDADHQYHWSNSSEARAKHVKIPLSVSADFEPFDMVKGEMRYRYEHNKLAAHLICSLESLPGWSWRATTRKAVYAKWGAEVDFELGEAYEDRPRNELIALKIKQYDALRCQWMSDPAVDPQLLQRLISLSNNWACLRFYTPDLLCLAAAKMLAKSLNHSRPNRDDDEEITLTSHYSWLLEFLRDFYRIEIPSHEYSFVSDDGVRIGVDEMDLLAADVNCKMRLIACISLQA